MTSETVKGFRDFTGQEAKTREAIKEIILKNFRLYGFEPAETPIVEFEEFVRGENSGDEAVSDIFKLEDKGKRKLALRYEFTFQLKRISANRKMPYKRYQVGEVFRDEPTSSNRFRQFVQCDVDVVGSSIKDEAEILMLLSRILNELNITATIYFNNRKLLNEIFDEQKISDKDAVMREIDKLDKLSEKEVKKNLEAYNAGKIIELFKKPEAYFKKYKSYKEIEELENAAAVYGINLVFQPSLARGLSYYNGLVFEIKSKEVKETLAAGGSYNVNSIQSTGCSFGLDRLSQLAKIKIPEKEALIISIGQDKNAVDLAEKLRNNGIACSVMFGKISKALEFANSYLLPYVIFLGEEEAKKKKLKLRNMKSGEEKMISEKDLIALLKS